MKPARYDWTRLLDADEGDWVNFGKGDRNSMQVCAKKWLRNRGIEVQVASKYDFDKNVLIATFVW